MASLHDWFRLMAAIMPSDRRRRACRASPSSMAGASSANELFMESKRSKAAW